MLKTLAPGLSVRNQSDIPVLFVLSQLSPLHWAKVMPGETVHIPCGRVFFTISTAPWIDGKEPTTLSVASRIAVAAVSFIVSPAAFVLVGALAAVTSVQSVRKSGVYANGRTVVIAGERHPTGVYELFFQSMEFEEDPSSSAQLPTSSTTAATTTTTTTTNTSIPVESPINLSTPAAPVQTISV